ncbi:non-specific lipid transfer protein GPI-anchored 3-like [Rhodamnia argentea]|uniref:Non-specific lipid transfer protein GPI-anchored 3-like n=1 Tax=Rhodamnia argentea TaxID=178133 RepID=A0A8B8Q2D5_9MYRT|nr:non-specific lipid transfer protein GPI-anchored 3-like [Rhodamnia argentea]
MASKSLFLLLISLSSCVSIAFSGNPSPSPPGGSNGTSLLCIQKLMPCTPYLKPSPSAPPASCCIPMKEVVANEAQCLCQVFNNADILKSFNVTQDEAMALAKACGANADVSECKTGGAPSSSPAATSPSHSHGAASSNSSGSPESAKDGANEVTPYLFRLGTLVAVSAIFLISGIVGFGD